MGGYVCYCVCMLVNLCFCLYVCLFVGWFAGSITFPSCELSQTGTYTMVASNTSGKVQKLVVFTVRKKGEGLQETVDGGGVAGVKPVPIKEFGDYVAHLHSNNNKLFKSQFKVSFE